MPRSIPSRDQISETTPLRLDVAAALAFPDGSIGAGALRGEAMKGTLAVERIAGKLYTTLKAIEDMRERCRVQPKAPACGPAPRGETPPAGSPTPRPGSFSTAGSNIPLESARMIVEELKGRSPSTSRGNTKPRGATVISLPSPSLT